MRIRILTAGLFLLFTITSVAQSKIALNYSVGFPTGETSDLFSTSWRGFTLDYSYDLDDNVSVGLSTGWQVFEESPGYVTETVGTETISGFRYNYLNSFPIYATASYNFNSTASLSPYATLGLGFTYNGLREDIGLISDDQSGWQFNIRPELGFDYGVGYNLSFRTALRYNIATESSDLPALSYLALTLGLVWGI